MNKNTRAIRAAEFILENKSTIREAANYFGYGKSTLHTDITKRLKNIDFELFSQIRKILDINYAEKHIRGGESTRIKYKNK